MSPSDAAWRLLKGPEDFDEIQDDLERSKTEGRRSFPEGRKKKRSMGSGSTEEEHEPRERPNARNRAPSLEATEAFYDSLELHPGSRGHEINTLRNEAGPRSHPPQFGTFMPLDTKEYIFEEDAESILSQEPPLGPDDRMRDVALRRESLSEVPTFAQTPFNPLTGFTRSEPMDLARRLLKEVNKNEKHPGNQTPGVHEAAPELKPKRKYFPTTLVHEDATEGIQRRVNPFKEEEGTFEGLPFKDDFKRSEPMDLAMRLLKSKYAGGPDQTILPSGDKPFNPKSRSLFQQKRSSSRGKTTPARVHISARPDGTRDFHLLDHEGKILSAIEDVSGFGSTPSRPIRDFHGYTPSGRRRKGYYRDLIESVLRHGFTLTSDDRNPKSNPFHKKFLRTLPDDIRAKIDAEQGKLDVGPLDPIRYEAHAPFSRTKDLDYGDLAVETRQKFPITYDTPFQYYQSKLNLGIEPYEDILAPTDEGPKRYRQTRLAGLGVPFNDGDRGGIQTKEGIIIPHKSSVLFRPFDQTSISESTTPSQPSTQTMMNFGIDPKTRARQRQGVVDSGAYGGQS